MKRDRYFRLLLFTALALNCWLTTAYSQDHTPNNKTYSANDVPESLKENANSVVRYFTTEVTVKGQGRETIKVHKIVTILNEKADREAIFVLGYNRKYDTYSDIQMRVYDPAGNVIKKYHKSDMYDGAASDGFSIVTDDRFLGVKHTIASYPQTIETEYEEDVTSSLNLDRWEIQHDQQAVEYATYKVSVDETAGFRYNSKNIALKPSKVTEGSVSTYYWEINGLKAVKMEENAEAWRVFPSIDFSVNNFQFCGIAGDFSSWNSFGKWLWALNSQVSALTPERTAEIRKMTDTIKTDKEKARFLYNYLQQSMRYVSVQLGIGGLQPFPAMFVDQKKYGDCKALSNYMCALLKAVNIPSYCAVINAEANKEPADPKFPFSSFNHEILCIPFKGDTTWLECTSNTQPFGKLGTFTENRRALLITEDGGKLVNTPASKMEDNLFNSEVHLTLNEDGGAKANVKISATGGYRSEYIGIASMKTDDQKEEYMHMLNIKQPITFDINTPTDKDGVKELDLNLEYDNFCDIKAGDKQFYKPHVFDLVAFTVPLEEHRKSDYYFEHPLQKTCVTTIDLPTGFTVETLPVNQDLKFTYGNYDVKYVYDAAKNQVTSTAMFKLTNHVIPAAKYAEMQEYLDAVAKAQNKKLVIKRKA